MWQRDGSLSIGVRGLRVPHCKRTDAADPPWRLPTNLRLPHVSCHTAEPRPASACSSSTTHIIVMARKNYQAGAQALRLVVSPLCCHAFVQPAGNMLQGGTRASSRHHHAQRSPAAVAVAAPAGRPRREFSIRATEASAPEFGGIQHAGVLVSDTKASKVQVAVELLWRRCTDFYCRTSNTAHHVTLLLDICPFRAVRDTRFKIPLLPEILQTADDYNSFLPSFW